MRRAEIARAIRELNNALAATHISEALRPFTMMRKEAYPSEAVSALLSAVKSYSIRASNFHDFTHQLAGILDISELERPQLWTVLISQDSGRRVAGKLLDSLLFAMHYLPKIAELIEQESIQEFKQSTGDDGSKYKDKSVLSIIVIEENDRFSSPARLVEVLESVELLYKSCAVMNNIVPEGLVVIACDSGSDKSFDFLGAAQVMDCVKEVIFSLWDRIIFFRERQLTERIELISQSLPVVERIAELEQEKKLEPEQAELLRRGIFEGVSRFMKSGATIPEITERAQFNPRQLMSAEPKQLTSSSSAPSTQEDRSIEEREDMSLAVEESAEDISTTEGLNLNNLNEGERGQFLRLLKKTLDNASNDASNAGQTSEHDTDKSDYIDASEE